MKRPLQRVEFFNFGERRIAQLLGLRPPPFVSSATAFHQLEYIETYLRQLKCQTVAIERHYIDRDYMEDHSVFYSRNLHPYPNSCRRLHFFSSPPKEIDAEITRLLSLALTDAESSYRRAVQGFSTSAYLGFSVVKHLSGCPVGRTVLRSFPPTADAVHERRFNCTRVYAVHFAGLELSVRGLPFQQQDLGVSACATTAIWSALHQFSELETFGNATPAQITSLAARYNLPFGRAMPQEGLSVDQMCQAIQALKVSPSLLRADDFEEARGYIYSAILSGIAPVLILDLGTRDRRLRHAVAVAGMKVKTKGVSFALLTGFGDQSAELRGLYLHDDRLGPYVRADIRRDHGKLALQIKTNGSSQKWLLEYVLIPLHAKVRLSFAALRRIAVKIVRSLQAYRDVVLPQAGDRKSTSITFSTSIVRPHVFFDRMLLSGTTTASKLRRLWETIPLPRYVGVVQLEASFLGKVYVLLDSTSTERNLNCCAVFAPGAEGNPVASEFASRIATELDARYIA